MKNARFPIFDSCALARKMNFVISIFDQQDYGLWGCGKWTLAIQRRQSRYRARLSSRQYSSSNIQMFLNENVSACTVTVVTVCCVFCLHSSSLGGKSIQSAQVDKDGPQESTGFRFLFQSVESKFWLKLSGCTSSSVDISDELLKHAKKVKATAHIAQKQ